MVKSYWIDITYGDILYCTDTEAISYAICAGNGKLIKVEDPEKAKLIYSPFKKREILEIFDPSELWLSTT